MLRRLRIWMKGRPRGELGAYAVLVAVALVLRLVALGDRAFHHDESQDAYFSWIFWTRGEYAYDPLLHGPLRFYLTALAYAIFGASDVSARLAPALMGTIMVALPYGLRHQLGRGAAFTAAVLLAVGPTYLYFSRFAREDIYVACLGLALLVVTFRFLARPRPHQPALIAGLLAASFATKESTFITVFVAGTFFLAEAVRERIAVGSWREAPLLATVASVGARAWAWAAVSFALVFAVLFTTFGTNPGGLWDGIHDGLAYWLGQQDVGRGGEPAGFYVVLLAGEEWPALLLGAVGAVVAVRRPTLLRAFLVWAFLLSLAVYSWAGEKFAWLVLHPLLPLLLLAGVGLEAIWGARRRWTGRVGLAATAVAAAYVAFASVSVNALHPTDPRELLVSTQSAPAVEAASREILAQAARTRRDEGRRPVIVVDTNEGATFPWAWYLRDEPVSYVDLTAGVPPLPADVVVATEAGRARLGADLAGYRAREVPFRVWWVRDYGAITPGSWLRWLLERTPWNPTGGMREWVYTRRS
jgi:uncharacterized protein (TIGR03663 family)